MINRKYCFRWPTFGRFFVEDTIGKSWDLHEQQVKIFQSEKIVSTVERNWNLLEEDIGINTEKSLNLPDEEI